MREITLHQWIIVLAIFAACGLANAQDDEYVKGELLVKFKSGISRKAALEFHKSAGAELVKHFVFIDVDHVTIENTKSVEDAISEYTSNAWVEFAEPNYIRKANGLLQEPFIPIDPRFPEQWALNNTGQVIQDITGTPDADIDAPEAWRFPRTDTEIVVAVLDSGIAFAHDDLIVAFWVNPVEDSTDGIDNDGNGYVDDTLGWDFVDGNNIPWDINGHGTSVSALIAGTSGDGGISGVAPGVKILPLRVLDDQGFTNVVIEIAAIDYVISLIVSGTPIRVVNISLGSPNSSNSELLALLHVGSA